MTPKPRVLLVTPFPPYPPDNGGMLRVLSLAARLKERCDLRLLTFVRETGERRFQQNAALLALRNIFSEVHCVPKESTELPAQAVPALPEVCREWYSPQMAARLAQLAEGVDVVHLEFFQLAFYAWHVRARPVVLTEHDTSHLSLWRSYFREWTGWARLARAREWLRVVRHHRQVCNRCDRIVALTVADEARLGRITAPQRIARIPTGVDLERFSFRPGRAGAQLAFIGHYPHYPNEDAAVWFCEKVFPRILAARPDARLLLVGSQPTPRVRALASSLVEVTGTVPDVRPYLDRAAVFVAPLRLGFGVKGKVLEAFARGTPVVATSEVAQGLPEARCGEHWLQAKSAADFAERTVRLLGDERLRDRLAKDARALAERCYGWQGSVDRLAGLYEELARERRGSAVEPEPAREAA